MKAAGAVLGVGSVLKFPLLLFFCIPLALKQWKFIVVGVITFVGIFVLSLAVDGVAINRAYFIDYLPNIALRDYLPDDVWSVRDTPKPPMTRWEGRDYITRYKFGAPSGSAARFFRSWTNYKLDRSLIVGGAGITALAILIGTYRRKRLDISEKDKRLWEDMAWSVVVMATLIVHTLSWITNYVAVIFVILLLWRFSVSSSNQVIARFMKYGLLIGTAAIVVGDPVMNLVPPGVEVVDIIIRNRVWLGGMLVWGILILLLVWPKMLTGSVAKK